DVSDPLRLVQSVESTQKCQVRDIHDSQAVVAEFRDKQPLAAEVSRQMVDPASHRPEGDPGFQLQRDARVARGSSTPGSEGEAEGHSRDANHGAAMTFISSHAARKAPDAYLRSEER